MFKNSHKIIKNNARTQYARAFFYEVLKKIYAKSNNSVIFLRNVI